MNRVNRVRGKGLIMAREKWGFVCRLQELEISRWAHIYDFTLVMFAM